MSKAAQMNRPPLVQQLSRLVNDLASVRDDESVSTPNDLLNLRWEDDGYVYLELNLLSSAGLEADISVLAGRVFIRVARSIGR
jgi:hypothetical protein